MIILMIVVVVVVAIIMPLLLMIILTTVVTDRIEDIMLVSLGMRTPKEDWAYYIAQRYIERHPELFK